MDLLMQQQQRVIKIALLNILLQNNKASKDCMNKIKNNLKEENLIKNPFIGTMANLPKEEGYILNITPVYPNFTIFGIPVAILGFVLSGFHLGYWVLPGLILAAFSFFWSKYFFFIMLYISLRKHGYKNKIKMIGNSTAIKKLIGV